MIWKYFNTGTWKWTLQYVCVFDIHYSERGIRIISPTHPKDGHNKIYGKDGSCLLTTSASEIYVFLLSYRKHIAGRCPYSVDGQLVHMSTWYYTFMSEWSMNFDYSLIIICQISSFQRLRFLYRKSGIYGRNMPYFYDSCIFRILFGTLFKFYNGCPAAFFR